MATKTIRYTATLPLDYVNELRGLAKENKIPSVNYAINVALDMYIREQKAAEYEDQMKNAGQDKAFLSRTMNCADDFSAIDGEVDNIW
ncbi:MAG: hypothetical protein FWE97_04015 [Dehalococcoidia bacterium]|nr:hypothetical protein [Dehalococcoidia bacterium]